MANKIFPATQKMIFYAGLISDKLNIEPPNFEDYKETSSFINRNIQDYKHTFEPSYKQILNDKPIWSNPKNLIEANQKLFSILEKYEHKNGCYVLWHDEEIVYIGKSINIAERVVSSILERNKYEKITGFSIYLTNSLADTHILEPVLITTFKPKLNVEFMCNDTSNFFKAPVTFEELKSKRINFNDIEENTNGK